jgi:hypothetical protein
MKWNTTRKLALGIAVGILAVAICLRLMGVARPILMFLHLLSLGACCFAIVAGGNSGSKG